MKRSKHSLSHYKLLTCDMAELVPVACLDVLPGDTIQQASSALIRVSPLLAPVMHPISVRIHHWFVPYRLVWPKESAAVGGWEQFITGGSNGQGDGAVFPTRAVGAADANEGTLLDYLGVPDVTNNPSISALPLRAYSLIWNEFYRDQDLDTARVIDLTGGADTTTDISLAKVRWEKDRFTSARPWAQKGPQVTLPLGTTAPVINNGQTLRFSASDATWVNLTPRGNSTNQNIEFGAGVTATKDLVWGSQTGLQADLTNATSVDVNTVREAFALQRYQEARAVYGSRYTEYLRYLGVRSSDARLQRPEYLGGGKQTISFSEVLQTGTNFDANTGVATLRGHGISAMRSRRYRRFFEEHGVVLSLLSVRPRTMYTSGIERMWWKTTKEDFYQRELESIGQQEILNREVYAMDSAPTDVFGYNDRYYEYRHHPSNISGEFRSTLNMWHLGRIFAGDQTLNATFVGCDPSKRIHAVQSADVLWIMVNNSIQARRMVRRNAAIGRIV